MTLRNRLLLLVAAFVLLIAVGGAIVIALTVVRDDRHAEETRLVIATERVAQLSTAYVDQETGQRGYVIAANPTFLEPYRQGRRVARRLRGDLRRLLRADFENQLSGIVDAAELWNENVERTIVTTERGEVVDTAALGVGKRRFDVLRSRVDRLGANIEGASQRAADATIRVRSAINAAMIATFASALVGLGVVAVLVRRWITVPVDDIGAAVRKVRSGSLDQPVPHVGPPEIAGLARDADEMRLRLSEMALEADRARESIEQNATVVLSLRASLRPDVGELPPGWSVAAVIRAAEGLVAGDCADVARIDENTVAVLVVDISGHGAIAGILALRCKEQLRAALALGADPGDALDSTAAQLGELGDETFLSAMVVLIDVSDGTLRYANAGHPPALVCRADGTKESLPPTGPIMGPFRTSWSTGRATLGPGENLGVYTDGIIEARRDGEMFGSDRLAALLGASDGEGAPAIVERLLGAVAAFTPGRLQDDATIVVICRPDR